MIIYVYGIQRSGKSTLISSFVDKYPDEFVHVERVKLMNKLSLEKYGKRFDGSQTVEEEDYLYKETEIIVRDLERKYKVVLLDCHAGYYTKDKKYIDFKRPEYHLMCDVYVLLQTFPEEIYHRMKETGWENNNFTISIDDISNYQELEKKQFQYYAKQKNKEAHIIKMWENPMESLEKIVRMECYGKEE